ncbi:MAG: SEC-C domain-containing protein [Myxococcota bacterium]
MEEIDFSSVGRNDPCPCGSGKKYKKCHYRKQQVQKQTDRQTVKLSDFLKPNQIAYLWFKGLKLILNRRDWSLFYEAFLEGGPLQTRYGSVEAFVEEARNRPTAVPAGGEFALKRFRFLDPFAFVMGARGEDDRRTTWAEYEVLQLQKTVEGFRLFDVEHRTYEQSDLDGNDPAFEDFELVQKAYAEARQAPIERPEVIRWVADPETGRAVRADGGADVAQGDDALLVVEGDVETGGRVAEGEDLVAVEETVVSDS